MGAACPGVPGPTLSRLVMGVRAPSRAVFVRLRGETPILRDEAYVSLGVHYMLESAVLVVDPA